MHVSDLTLVFITPDTVPKSINQFKHISAYEKTYTFRFINILESLKTPINLDT